MSYKVEIDVNGNRVVVEAEPDTPFLYVLRNGPGLGLRAAKLGCGLEQCHACAVLADGEAVPTCVTPRSPRSPGAASWSSSEGLADGGRLHAVQQAPSLTRRPRSAGTASPA